ncbi:hypothetical protein ACOCGJ_003490, partial [Vibrio cholerae]
FLGGFTSFCVVHSSSLVSQVSLLDRCEVFRMCYLEVRNPLFCKVEIRSIDDGRYEVRPFIGSQYFVETKEFGFDVFEIDKVSGEKILIDTFSKTDTMHNYVSCQRTASAIDAALDVIRTRAET